VSRAEREARRAWLHEALTSLKEPGDPERQAEEVVRALDAYLDAHPGAALTPREPPVMDFERRERQQVRFGTWFVLGGAVLVTIVVAIVLSGGWPAGLAILGIWLVALFVMTST
jgi:hypothetical protein